LNELRSPTAATSAVAVTGPIPSTLRGVRPRLIVIDTLAQTLFGGEENGAGMVIFVANATALANHFNACVIAVHHVPLADDKRLRGHGSLHGGADAELLTERANGELTVTVTLEKAGRRDA
jgi:RecA-family ATPase